MQLVPVQVHFNRTEYGLFKMNCSESVLNVNNRQMIDLFMQVYRKRQPGGPAVHYSEQNASQQSESLHTSRGKTHIRHQQGIIFPYCLAVKYHLF